MFASHFDTFNIAAIFEHHSELWRVAFKTASQPDTRVNIASIESYRAPQDTQDMPSQGIGSH